MLTLNTSFSSSAGTNSHRSVVLILAGAAAARLLARLKGEVLTKLDTYYSSLCSWSLRSYLRRMIETTWSLKIPIETNGGPSRRS